MPGKQPWLAHYDIGVPLHIGYPEKTIVDLFEDTATVFPNKTCTVYGTSKLTYSRISFLSDMVANYLLSSGVQKGERISILLPNIPEFIIAYYGILKVGGVVLALNPSNHHNELIQQINEVDVKRIFLEQGKYRSMVSDIEQTSLDGFIVVGNTKEKLRKNDICFKTIFKSKYSTLIRKVIISPDDAAIFQYSGGTTGLPKCAIGTHRNLVANAIQFRKWLVNTEEGNENVLIAIPLYHVYGMVLGMNLAVLLGAGMILIPDPRNLDNLLSQIEQHQATIFPGVPNLYSAINRLPAVQEGRYDLSSIKVCVSGSATLPEHTKTEFEQFTGGHLVEGYGLSEAPTATHCNPILGENRIGSIGLPLPDVECRIVNIETGMHDVPQGGIGELIVRGPQVMQGYYHQPDETELVLRDGWLFTGDICKMDAEGYFYLIDRKKDVIKVGGFQVWPNEVEKVILENPKVQDAAVAGVFDQNKGEMVKAWVVIKSGKTATGLEIISWCKQYLTRYKAPTMVEFVDVLPRSGVGKVLRRILVTEHMRRQVKNKKD